jgi:deoxyribodipyrimidine photo-lyase
LGQGVGVNMRIDRDDPIGVWLHTDPRLADALNHAPWKASAQPVPAAGRIHGEPILGRSAAPERALAAYRGLKGEEISREGR